MLKNNQIVLGGEFQNPYFHRGSIGGGRGQQKKITGLPDSRTRGPAAPAVLVLKISDNLKISPMFEFQIIHIMEAIF